MTGNIFPETTTPSEVTPTAIDTRIHAPKRLAVLAILRGTKEAEFAFLQERLNLAASDLSKQMTTLIDAGFVETRKTGHGRGSSTWYRLTESGKADFDAYKATLKAMLDG